MGWWSGSRCKPRVHTPVLKKKKKRLKQNKREREWEKTLAIYTPNRRFIFKCQNSRERCISIENWAANFEGTS
jgi:hypothetical protein